CAMGIQFFFDYW
nr:immunoglobulin heavy chain junction region [Macaca mulatta]MOY28808.1 immunoglobulin heavy chain junction region [Macaca mulatta]